MKGWEVQTSFFGKLRREYYCRDCGGKEHFDEVDLEAVDWLYEIQNHEAAGKCCLCGGTLEPEKLELTSRDKFYRNANQMIRDGYYTHEEPGVPVERDDPEAEAEDEAVQQSLEALDRSRSQACDGYL